MAGMQRPCRKSYAILRHDASWGDRFPRSATKSRGAILSIASKLGSPFCDRLTGRILPARAVEPEFDQRHELVKRSVRSSLDGPPL